MNDDKPVDRASNLPRHFHYYDRETGEIHALATVINCPTDKTDAVAAANAPPGHAPLEGRFDRHSQRVNLSSGCVEDYQPPPPSDDHEWNAATKRSEERRV